MDELACQGVRSIALYVSFANRVPCGFMHKGKEGRPFGWGDVYGVPAGAGGHKGPHSAALPLPPLREAERTGIWQEMSWYRAR